MISVLVVGLGNMGISHALAYHNNPLFKIVGLVNRSSVSPPEVLQPYKYFTDFERALTETKPDLVSICTYSDTHAEYAITAMNAGAHVFVEKPIATKVSDAKRVVDTAVSAKRKLIVGYILRHHPSWQKFITKARELGGPYVFRLNLNQQSTGTEWETHKQLMATTSPIVDCGVHYVDVMCQITDSNPVQVRGMGVRLSDEIDKNMYNYGHFQVLFADSSVGWYEAAWGPMVSETAYFVKDVISPRGAISIIEAESGGSSDINSHTKVGKIKVHSSLHGDKLIDLANEPGHQDLCNAEQAFVAKAIQEDLDLTRHMNDAVQSLSICLAADQSVRTGKSIDL